MILTAISPRLAIRTFENTGPRLYICAGGIGHTCSRSTPNLGDRGSTTDATVPGARSVRGTCRRFLLRLDSLMLLAFDGCCSDALQRAPNRLLDSFTVIHRTRTAELSAQAISVRLMACDAVIERRMPARLRHLLGPA
jgi:hypothetical protein